MLPKIQPSKFLCILTIFLYIKIHLSHAIFIFIYFTKNFKSALLLSFTHFLSLLCLFIFFLIIVRFIDITMNNTLRVKANCCTAYTYNLRSKMVKVNKKPVAQVKPYGSQRISIFMFREQKTPHPAYQTMFIGRRPLCFFQCKQNMSCAFFYPSL